MSSISPPISESKITGIFLPCFSSPNVSLWVGTRTDFSFSAARRSDDANTVPAATIAAVSRNQARREMSFAQPPDIGVCFMLDIKESPSVREGVIKDPCQCCFHGVFIDHTLNAVVPPSSRCRFSVGCHTSPGTRYFSGTIASSPASIYWPPFVWWQWMASTFVPACSVRGGISSGS